MVVSVDGRQRYTWPVSTGTPDRATPAGSFQPFRLEEQHLSKEWDDAPMPHSIFFTKSGHAIHGSQAVARLGTPASHGCVRLAPSNATTLYGLVAWEGLENTRVVITGAEPTQVAKADPDAQKTPEISSSRPATPSPKQKAGDEGDAVLDDGLDDKPPQANADGQANPRRVERPAASPRRKRGWIDEGESVFADSPRALGEPGRRRERRPRVHRALGAPRDHRRHRARRRAPCAVAAQGRAHPARVGARGRVPLRSADRSLRGARHLARAAILRCSDRRRGAVRGRVRADPGDAARRRGALRAAARLSRARHCPRSGRGSRASSAYACRARSTTRSRACAAATCRFRSTRCAACSSAC